MKNELFVKCIFSNINLNLFSILDGKITMSKCFKFLPRNLLQWTREILRSKSRLKNTEKICWASGNFIPKQIFHQSH